MKRAIVILLGAIVAVLIVGVLVLFGDKIIAYAQGRAGYIDCACEKPDDFSDKLA